MFAPPCRTRFLLCMMASLLTSCVHLFITHVDYATVGVPPLAAGVAFRAEFIPQGTESGLAVSAGVVGGATVGEIGPYQVRLHAFGKPGEEEVFRITRFALTSPGHFIAPMERRGFEGVAEFEPTTKSGSTRASLLLGPRFRLDKHRDKELLLDADVEVRRQGRWIKGTLRLPLHQTKTRRRESLFLFTEIAKDIRGGEGPVPPALPHPPEQP